MRSEFLIDGPERAKTTLVLAHGAGAPMDSPFLDHFATALSARGLRVVRFEFPYMDGRREGVRRPPNREPVLRSKWLSVIDRLGGGPSLVIGGKSLGGRMASLVADEAGARGLVCLGYPFHSPKWMDHRRVVHLTSLRSPTLVVQGTRDPFGGRDEIERYALAPTIQVVWIEDGDHSFAPRKASGRTLAQNLDVAVEAVASFVDSLG